MLFLNCEIHGFITGDQLRSVTIKNKEYLRCRECQKEKDKKYSKTFRNKNKDYYKKKKQEHYELKPEMQMERNKRYRKKKAQVAQ